MELVDTRDLKSLEGDFVPVQSPAWSASIDYIFIKMDFKNITFASTFQLLNLLYPVITVMYVARVLGVEKLALQILHFHLQASLQCLHQLEYLFTG